MFVDLLQAAIADAVNATEAILSATPPLPPEPNPSFWWE